MVLFCPLYRDLYAISFAIQQFNPCPPLHVRRLPPYLHGIQIISANDVHPLCRDSNRHCGRRLAPVPVRLQLQRRRLGRLYLHLRHRRRRFRPHHHLHQRPVRRSKNEKRPGYPRHHPDGRHTQDTSLHDDRRHHLYWLNSHPVVNGRRRRGGQAHGHPLHRRHGNGLSQRLHHPLPERVA